MKGADMADTKKAAERFLAERAAADLASGPGFFAPAMGAAVEALLDAGRPITLDSLVEWCRQKGGAWAVAADRALDKAARNPPGP